MAAIAAALGAVQALTVSFRTDAASRPITGRLAQTNFRFHCYRNPKPEAQFKGYSDHGGQRIRHMALIRERYGFTEFADNGPARFRLTRWLYALCWSGDDHPGPLVERATSWLVVNKVLLPVVGQFENEFPAIR